MDVLGFEVDFVDASGIDLMCYNGKKVYGVSVKTRQVEKKENGSINLKSNDILYPEKSTKLRNKEAETLYAFVVYSFSEIDLMICTQEYVFKKIGIYSREHYEAHGNKETKGFSIKKEDRQNWGEMYEEGKEKGIIFAASYVQK
ncbi:MAG: hypothetical protein J5988_07740 [Eubacterium sp.]|nr:hypothetical protein [Eubacterium sp.]